MVEVFANSGDPDQMPHSAMSDLSLHCLPVTRLGVSSLQWVRATLSNLIFLLKPSNFFPVLLGYTINIYAKYLDK